MGHAPDGVQATSDPEAAAYPEAGADPAAPRRVPDTRMTDERRDEPELVRAVQEGDESAYGALVDRYLDQAYALAMSILQSPADAQDAVQDAFIRALERIDHLQEGSPFGPWFYRVLKTTSLNLRRREELRRGEPIPLSASGSRNPGRDLEENLTRRRVLDAVGELPEKQRLAVTLYDLEGYSHREVADILDIAVGTSRAHVHHGRQTLRRLLSDRETEELTRS